METKPLSYINIFFKSIEWVEYFALCTLALCAVIALAGLDLAGYRSAERDMTRPK